MFYSYSRNTSGRKKFDIAALSKKHGFGYALSFNGLKATYDEYADVLRKELYPEEKTAEMEKNVEDMPKEITTEAEPEMEMKCVMVPKVKDEMPKEVKEMTKEEVKDNEMMTDL